MSYIKKALAVVLILVMTLGLVVAGNAETTGSPVNPGYDPATETDTEINNGTVTEYFVGTSGEARVDRIQQDLENPKTTAKLTGGKDANNNPVEITTIGDGSNGILNSKTGRKITKVTVSSSKTVTIKRSAFYGSKASKIQMKNRKTTIKKNAFTGTKQKKVTIELKSAKKASDVQVYKNSFKGLSSDSTIILSKDMSKKQVEKLTKKLRDAGFTGKIKQK